MPGMTFVAVRFIDHIEALRRERCRKLFRNKGLNLHGCLSSCLPAPRSRSGPPCL
jgi:hypothetical protein